MTIKRVLIGAGIIGLFLSNNAVADLVVALKPDKNPDAMLSEKKTLEEFLQKQTGQKTKVIIPLSGAVIQEGLQNGSIDVAFVSGMEMVQAEKNGAAEILLAVEIEGKRSYESYWVTKKDRAYKSIADLKGKPVAFSSRTSTSGYLIPMYDLIKQKLLPKGGNPEDFFGRGNVSFGTGYVSAIERVLAGEAEAAAVSDYVIKGDKHLSPEQKAELRVLDTQGPVPTHMLAARKSLGKKEKKDLESAFLQFNKNEEIRNKLFTAKLVKTNAKKQLSALKEALNLTGIKF